MFLFSPSNRIAPPSLKAGFLAATLNFATTVNAEMPPESAHSSGSRGNAAWIPLVVMAGLLLVVGGGYGIYRCAQRLRAQQRNQEPEAFQQLNDQPGPGIIIQR